MRSVATPSTPLALVQSLVPRLRTGQLIAGATALRVWRYPHPGRWMLSDDVDVVVATGTPRPRTRGVRAHRLAAGRAQAWTVDGIPVIDPVAAVFMCARSLTDDQVVTALDALATTSESYPGRFAGRPRFDTVVIANRLAEWGRFPGSGRVRRALASTRGGVESPKETETRLMIVSHGLPEPEIQVEVSSDGVLVARLDLAYPALRIAIEYEGDGHRTDRDQWRRDIQRQRALEDLGWIVIRLTQLDLSDDGRLLLDRLRRALASRRRS